MKNPPQTLASVFPISQPLPLLSGEGFLPPDGCPIHICPAQIFFLSAVIRPIPVGTNFRFSYSGPGRYKNYPLSLISRRRQSQTYQGQNRIPYYFCRRRKMEEFRITASGKIKWLLQYILRLPPSVYRPAYRQEPPAHTCV